MPLTEEEKMKIEEEERVRAEARLKYNQPQYTQPQPPQQNAGKTYRIIKTITFEATESGQREMARRILELENNHWKEIGRVSKSGKYKGGQGCCLFLIFMPLAFLAGHTADKVIVTFEKHISEEEMLREKAIMRKKQRNIIICWVVGFVIFSWFVGRLR